MSVLRVSRKWYVISLSVSLLTLAYLIDMGGGIIILTPLLHISMEHVVLGYFAFITTSFLRTLRFRVAFEERKISFLSLHLTTSVYAAVGGVVPGGFGEFAYPILLKRNNNVNIVDGMCSVVYSRIHDLTAIIGLLLISAGMVMDNGGLSAAQRSSLTSVGLILTLLVLGLEKFLLLAKLAIKKASGVIHAELQQRLVLLLSQLIRFASNFDRPKPRILMLMFTLAIWITASLGIHFFLVATDTEIGLPAAVLVTTSGLLFSVIPLTIAGAGLREAAYAGAMVLSGVEASTAAAVAISIRVLSLPVNFVNLLLAYILEVVWKRD